MTDTASTNNWDTVSAIKFKAVNSAICAQKSSPASFSGEETSPLSDTKYTISANFDAWQLSGGSGNLVHMRLPFNSGKAVQEGAKTSLNLGSGYGTIEVNLTYIAQVDQTNKQDLKVDPSEVVTNVKVTMDDPSEKNWGPYVQVVLTNWLDQNLKEFNHVFAVANLGSKETAAAFKWLKPTKVGYAVEAVGDNVDEYVFGVLAMTDNRPGNSLAYQVSPYSIPTDADAGFLISTERFLDKMFMPGVVQIFKDTQEDDFDTTADGTQITNITALNFKDFEVPTNSSGTETKTITDATIGPGNFMLTAFDRTIRIQFVDLKYTWKEGFTVKVDYTGVSKLEVDSGNHFQMPETANPTMTFTIIKTEAERWKEIGESIGIGVGSALIGALIGGAAEAAVATKAAQSVLAKTIAEAVEEAGGSAVIGGDIAIPLLTPEEQAELRAAQAVEALDSAAEELANPGNLQKFTGWFARKWKIILGTLIGAAIGGGLSQIPEILRYYAAKDLAHMPTLDEFTDEAVSPISWANTPNFKLKSIALNGPVQMGLVED